MSDPVHFPSDREGLTWCGLPFAPPNDGALSGVDSNGLHYSTSMADVTCPGCETDEPTYPTAIDAAMRSQEPLVGRMLSDLGIDEMLNERIAVERKAWARLVKAACPPCDGMCCADEANAEYDGARQALCDLGVPVDELLGEP